MLSIIGNMTRTSYIIIPVKYVLDRKTCADYTMFAPESNCYKRGSCRWPNFQSNTVARERGLRTGGNCFIRNAV